MMENLKADITRIRSHGNSHHLLRLLLFEQGLWALICYRAGNHLQRHRLPPGLHQLVMFFYHVWWKWVQMATGINLKPDCTIGPGLYLGHWGQIFVHPDTVIGRDCNLSHEVTIGLGRRDGKWGVPRIGNRVYVAPGAKIFGPIEIADGTVVGANAVVNRSTDRDAVVAGVPARVISHEGSGDYIA